MFQLRQALGQRELNTQELRVASVCSRGSRKVSSLMFRSVPFPPPPTSVFILKLRRLLSSALPRLIGQVDESVLSNQSLEKAVSCSMAFCGGSSFLVGLSTTLCLSYSVNNSLNRAEQRQIRAVLGAGKKTINKWMW